MNRDPQLQAILARRPETRPPARLVPTAILLRNPSARSWCPCMGARCEEAHVDGITAHGERCRMCASIGGQA